VLASDYKFAPTERDIIRPIMDKDALIQPKSRAAFKSCCAGWTDGSANGIRRSRCSRFWDYSETAGRVTRD